MVQYNNLSKLIYLGNFAQIDTDESTSGYEGSTAPIIGTVLSGAAANDNVVDFDYDDADNDGNFEPDHHGGPAENLTVNGVSSEIDEVVMVSVRLTYPGGGTSTTSVIGYQLVNGDFYIGDFVDRIEGQSVTSLEVIGISDTGDAGNISGFQNGGTYDLDGFTFVACFESGTRILTEHGAREIGSVQVGDKVMTVDNGLQPVRWRSSQAFRWDGAAHKDKPVRIAAGALGAGLPTRALMVSPQHRVLMADPTHPEGVLAPAKKLVGLKGVRQMRGRRHAEYVHILFDRHQIIFAERAPCESFLPGPEAMKGLSGRARAELESCLARHGLMEAQRATRIILKNRDAEERARAGIGRWTWTCLAAARLQPVTIPEKQTRRSRFQIRRAATGPGLRAGGYRPRPISTGRIWLRAFRS